jgi:hypothetical protein
LKERITFVPQEGVNGMDTLLSWLDARTSEKERKGREAKDVADAIEASIAQAAIDARAAAKAEKQRRLETLRLAKEKQEKEALEKERIEREAQQAAAVKEQELLARQKRQEAMRLAQEKRNREARDNEAREKEAREKDKYAPDALERARHKSTLAKRLDALRLERAELLRATEEIVEEDRRRKEAERTRRLNYIDKHMEPSRLALSRKASDLESRLDALNAVPRSRMADSAQDRFGRDRRRLLNDWDEYKGELSAWKEHLRALEDEVFSELGG